MSLDPFFALARYHAVLHGPLPVSSTPTADILDGDYDTSPYVLSPLAAIKLGYELAMDNAVAVAERRLNLCYQRADGRGINDAKQTVAELKTIITSPKITIPPKVRSMHPDLEGHITDEVQDACRELLGKIVPMDVAAKFASRITAKMDSITPKTFPLECDALPSQVAGADDLLCRARQICADHDSNKANQYLEGERDDYMPMTAVIAALQSSSITPKPSPSETDPIPSWQPADRFTITGRGVLMIGPYPFNEQPDAIIGRQLLIDDMPWYVAGYETGRFSTAYRFGEECGLLMREGALITPTPPREHSATDQIKRAIIANGRLP